MAELNSYLTGLTTTQAQKFLTALCLKVGLPKNQWRQELKVQTYQVEKIRA
ncbi:MAG: hypothetical protein WCW02_03330 [Candidatus Buchananbacteria bacterium]